MRCPIGTTNPTLPAKENRPLRVERDGMGWDGMGLRKNGRKEGRRGRKEGGCMCMCEHVIDTEEREVMM